MIDRDIKIFLLKAIYAANGQPMATTSLNSAVQAAFSKVALTGSDVPQYLADLEQDGFVANTNDDFLGVVWDLTPKGKIRAQTLSA